MTRTLCLVFALLCAAGCAHTHLHVYGRVRDVTRSKRGRPLEGAELWTFSEAGEPQRRLAVTNKRGEYELELQPEERDAPFGVQVAGYAPSWRTVGKLNREERRAHTKEIDFLLREE